MARSKAKIVVLGSLIVDFRVRVPRAAENGETLVVTESGIFAGGKGLNQAVGVKRLGGRPWLVGRVGDDVFGKFLADALKHEKIGLESIVIDQDLATGTAIPVSQGDGQYILHVPGANQALIAAEVSRLLEATVGADYVMLQGEVNREANLVAGLWAKERGVAIVLDPAPAQAMSEDLLSLADYLTPNQVELAQLTQSSVAESVDEAVAQADLLFAQQPQLMAVVATLGPWGAYVASRQGHFQVTAETVAAVDPTAAGDVFNAAFTVAMAEGESLRRATEFGVRAGTYACQIAGALPSIPRRQDLDWRR